MQEVRLKLSLFLLLLKTHLPCHQVLSVGGEGQSCDGFPVNNESNSEGFDTLKEHRKPENEKPVMPTVMQMESPMNVLSPQNTPSASQKMGCDIFLQSQRSEVFIHFFILCLFFWLPKSFVDPETPNFPSAWKQVCNGWIFIFRQTVPLLLCHLNVFVFDLPCSDNVVLSVLLGVQ